MKKLIVGLMAMVMVFSSASCSAVNGLFEKTGISSSELTAWANNSAEKSHQQMAEIDADSTVLEIAMAKGEKEGAQLMLTANETFRLVDIQVERLENGNAYIPEENVSLYFCHYMELTHVWNNNPSYNEGDYVSDALFPMETAFEYGMTKILKGNTQSIYIEVETTSDMVAGVYTSYVTFKTTRAVYRMPIVVTVWDYDISKATSKNYMGTNYRWETFGSAELDSTEYMSTIYFERTMEYRMNSDLPHDGRSGAAGYVELLRKYYNWDNFTTYRMYYEPSYRGGIDVTILDEYLSAIIEASLEDKTNYLDKAIFYASNMGVDEPHAEQQYKQCILISGQLQDTLKSVNERYMSKVAGTDDFNYYTEYVSPALLQMPNILTLSLHAACTIVADRGGEYTSCPQIQFMESQAMADTYYELAETSETQKTIWYYTCCNPDYPYPSYHINDYNLGFRIMYWMQKDFGFDGYLCWSSAMTSMHYGINPFENDSLRADSSMRMMQQTAGDGFFFYPGYAYGIEGPIASLRAVAFRDGQEDYESLKVLDDLYAEKGLSADDILDSYFTRLYTGTKPITSMDEFVAVRKALAQAILEADNTCGLLYDEISYVNDKATVRFATSSEDAEVYYNNQLLTAENGFYTVTLDLKVESYLKVKVVCGKESLEHNKFIAGKYTVIDKLDAESALNRFRVNSDSAMEINTDSKYIAEGFDASVKLAITGRENAAASFYPFFSIEMSDVNAENVMMAGVRIYCDSYAGMTFTISTFNGVSYMEIKTITLKHGWNDISLDIANVGMSYDNKLYFRTSNMLDLFGNAKTVNLYLNGLYYLEKEAK